MSTPAKPRNNNTIKRKREYVFNKSIKSLCKQDQTDYKKRENWICGQRNTNIGVKPCDDCKSQILRGETYIKLGQISDPKTPPLPLSQIFGDFSAKI